MRRVRLLGLIVVALALVAGCGAATASMQQAGGMPGSIQNTPTVPDQLRFTATTVEGKNFSGQSLAGKPAVLWFWAPWCPICQHEAPGVARVAHANPGVRFVGVAALDQLPAMKQFVSRYQMGSFTNLADLDASVWRRFGVTAQPAFAFIGPDGTVDVVRGPLSAQQLTARVHQLAGA